MNDRPLGCQMILSIRNFSDITDFRQNTWMPQKFPAKTANLAELAGESR
jgi:hypothetical protein